MSIVCPNHHGQSFRATRVAYAMSMTSVRQSVCNVGVLVYCDHKLQDTAELLIPHERAITLVF